jgi:pyridoxamine 5'-phosphate oxidase
MIDAAPHAADPGTAAFAEPFRRFGELLERAAGTDLREPTAMSLATASAEGRPSVRMVLLKGFDEDGFVFYTNLESRKAGDLAANPFAALCFHWQPLEVQVRIEGRVEPVSADEADAYYASRPRGSRIGAWASKQSRPLESRFALEKAVAEYTARYAVGNIPRPAHWSGFRIRPVSIECRHDRPFRLHDRVEFRRTADGKGWEKVRMYP